MLKLTRREGESIAIGDDIQVFVIDVRNGQVRIGIAAPKSVEVQREEVLERMRAKQAALANALI